MSESQNKERMNTIFQEAKLRGLPEAESGVDHRGYFTLTWTSGASEITAVFTSSVNLSVTMDGQMAIDFNLADRTDAEVVDRIERELAKAAA